MKWDENYSSSEVDDRRSERGPGGGGGGGLGLIVRLFSMFGWRGALVGVVIAGAAVVGTQFMGGGDSSSSSGQYQGAPSEERAKHLVAFVFDDVQTTWRTQLPGYRDARLELFHGSLASACGTATEAVGPFYCPNDRKVYIDLAFYDELRRRFGAPGEFAEAYVIAHEVGHHVQNQRGLLSKGTDSVHVELQADCLAGAWAKDASRRGIVDVGDVDQALNAAAQIGDDAIQRRETGRVRPETFTHGSSAQRTTAFRTGLQGGPSACGIN